MIQRIPQPRFVFHTHKHKARKLAGALKQSASKLGMDFVITDASVPMADHIAIFYGVVPDTYASFRYYMAEGRAIYLDNGWLSRADKPTFRFSWNSAQPFFQDLDAPNYPFDPTAHGHSVFDRKPEPDLALLVLQSEAYYKNLRLPYSRDAWAGAAQKLLTQKGYRVEIRDKPSKQSKEQVPLKEQLSRAGIVVSMNSAVCVKSLLQGIPSYCLLDCTLSPFAPVRLPDIGKAAPPARSDVLRLYNKLVYNDIPMFELTEKKALSRILSVVKQKRRGYWYANQ